MNTDAAGNGKRVKVPSTSSDLESSNAPNSKKGRYGDETPSGLPSPNMTTFGTLNDTRSAQASPAQPEPRRADVDRNNGFDQGKVDPAMDKRYDSTVGIGSTFSQETENGTIMCKSCKSKHKLFLWAELISTNSKCENVKMGKVSNCGSEDQSDYPPDDLPRPVQEGLDHKATSGENLAAAGYLLGRSEECDVIIRDPQISNRHCLIYKETLASGNLAVFIEDMSANGTYINGQKLGRNNRQRLHNGDEISLTHSRGKDEDVSFIFKQSRGKKGKGKTFDEAFILGKTLGSGHFAEVKLGIERASGTQFAIKVFKRKPHQRSKDAGNLAQEIGILMGATHPYITCIREVFDEDQFIYIVMELAPGGELFDLIIERQKLTENETRHIFLQLLTGLKYLHERNIVHRDIKPENILVMDKGNMSIRLADFGLAKIVGEDSFTTSLCGTPSYVAPEILVNTSHRKYGHPVDVWSCGVVLYICLCGFPPFSDELAPPSMQEQIKTAKFEFPSPYWDPVSDPALHLIERMLTVDPNERITVAEALEHPWMKGLQPEAYSNASTPLDIFSLADLDITRRTGIVRERTKLADMNPKEAAEIGETKVVRPNVDEDDSDKTKLDEMERARETFMAMGESDPDATIYDEESEIPATQVDETVEESHD
ncbi:serine/threonine protein kinase [Saitoella coloradoensis]